MTATMYAIVAAIVAVGTIVLAEATLTLIVGPTPTVTSMTYDAFTRMF